MPKPKYQKVHWDISRSIILINQNPRALTVINPDDWGIDDSPVLQEDTAVRVEVKPPAQAMIDSAVKSLEEDMQKRAIRRGGSHTANRTTMRVDVLPRTLDRARRLSGSQKVQPAIMRRIFSYIASHPEIKSSITKDEYWDNTISWQMHVTQDQYDLIRDCGDKGAVVAKAISELWHRSMGK